MIVHSHLQKSADHEWGTPHPKLINMEPFYMCTRTPLKSGYTVFAQSDAAANTYFMAEFCEATYYLRVMTIHEWYLFISASFPGYSHVLKFSWE